MRAVGHRPTLRRDVICSSTRLSGELSLINYDNYAKFGHLLGEFTEISLIFRPCHGKFQWILSFLPRHPVPAAVLTAGSSKASLAGPLRRAASPPAGRGTARQRSSLLAHRRHLLALLCRRLSQRSDVASRELLARQPPLGALSAIHQLSTPRAWRSPRCRPRSQPVTARHHACFPGTIGAVWSQRIPWMWISGRRLWITTTIHGDCCGQLAVGLGIARLGHVDVCQVCVDWHTPRPPGITPRGEMWMGYPHPLPAEMRATARVPPVIPTIPTTTARTASSSSLNSLDGG